MVIIAFNGFIISQIQYTKYTMSMVKATNHYVLHTDTRYCWLTSYARISVCEVQSLKVEESSNAPPASSTDARQRTAY